MADKPIPKLISLYPHQIVYLTELAQARGQSPSAYMREMLEVAYVVKKQGETKRVPNERLSQGDLST